MAKQRFLVGGPSNSGKSTYVLSLVNRLQTGMGHSARAVELDVWSSSYPAFRGEVTFKDRPKQFGLDWDWKTPLDARLKEFNEAGEDVVFGDLPGAKIDEATEYMCREAQADGAIIISRKLEGLELWREVFERFDIPVVFECMSFQGSSPLPLQDLDRVIDPRHADVAFLADGLLPAPYERSTMQIGRFRTVFKMNYFRRSQTAHGRDINLDQPHKKPLMVLGERLKAAAMENCVALTEDIIATSRPATWTAELLRNHCERWFDIANRGIYSPQWYEDEFAELQADAELVSKARGAPVRVNSRYRIWTPEHTLMKVSPILLEEQMEHFYVRLAELLGTAQKRKSWKDALNALAYADLMMDGELRPWLDGCGRVTTALVMWLSRVTGVALPLFAESKEVHKMTIRDLDRHVQYFVKCIRNAELQVP